MKYFAYGSNMCTKRLKSRVPSAKSSAVAWLPCHGLRFHKRSMDGSGKCDAYETGRQHDVVHGVVLEIDACEKPKLDSAEGLGAGYVEKCVEVVAKNGSITAFTYVAEPAYICPCLKPYDWYKEFVIGGAEEHKLDKDYVNRIREVPAQCDPDRCRARKERKNLPCEEERSIPGT